MVYALGPRSQRVYALLRDRLLTGQLAPGTKLPSHTALAAEFGVAPLTVRHALAELEREGLIAREQGRGTFIREHAMRAVLIVEDDVVTRTLLRAYVTKAGFRPIETAGPREGLAALDEDDSIVLVLSDVHMPDKEDGIGFIRAVARRWPEIPLAAVTAYPPDLLDLHGTPEGPFLIIAKPVQTHQIEGVLRLVMHPYAMPASTSHR